MTMARLAARRDTPRNEAIEVLANHPRLRTRRADELECFLAAKRLGVQVGSVPRNGPALDAIVNAYYVSSVCVCYVRYGAPATLLAPDDLPEFNLIMAARSTYLTRVGKTEVHCGRLMASLGSPSMEQTTRLQGDSARYSISIPQWLLVRHLESILQEPLTTPLRFAPAVKLETAAGAGLMAMVRFLFEDISRTGSGYLTSTVATHVEQLLVSHLLIHQPHNYQRQLERPTHAPAPRDVRRVLDYIHAALHEPITLEQLVTVSGVPGRSLNEHFRRFTGSSPTAYVTEQRIARVRQDLLSAGPQETVTAAATRWGFTQLGRFAGAYRRRYGESPSDTLGRARRERQG